MSATAPIAKRLPAAFPYIGGKWRLAPKIVKLLPEHRVYVEVFGGSGAVLFAKQRTQVEVYNDVDADAVNFFRVLRDETMTDRLMMLLIHTPYSRREYRDLCHMPAPADPVLRAWRYWAIARMCYGGYRPANNGKSFAGSTVGRWRRSLSARHQLGGDAATLHNKIDELARFAERLRGVYIEDKDFPYILSRWDSAETFFYLDPPYFGTEGYYDGGLFPTYRHVELADLLARIQGKAIVSYYPHPKVDELYPKNKWRRVLLAGTKNHQSARRGMTKEKTTELLLCNFDLESAE